jgi:hypothetical protein
MYLLNFAQAPADFVGSGPKSGITNSKEFKKIQDLCMELVNVTYLQGKILMYAFKLAFW